MLLKKYAYEQNTSTYQRSLVNLAFRYFFSGQLFTKGGSPRMHVSSKINKQRIKAFNLESFKREIDSEIQFNVHLEKEKKKKKPLNLRK